MRQPIAVLVVAAVTSFAAVAAADIPSPQQEGCFGKAVGAACTYLENGFGPAMAGECANGTCYRATPDGSVSSPCLLCSDASAIPDAGSDAGADAGRDAGSSIDAGAAAPAPVTSGGCSMSHTGPLLGAFGIAMAVPLLLRRRRRS
jgi:hypothetical protein